MTITIGKLGQRETWLYLAGIFIPVASVIYTMAGGDATFLADHWEPISAFTASLLGPGAYAHVKRGEQRGKEIADTLRKQEGPWV